VKWVPRMVPASFDFCLAKLTRDASSSGTSIRSEHRALLQIADFVHHVDRKAAFVEDVGHSDVLDPEGSGLERPQGDDEVGFLP
jgi:hypothetical protein